MKDKVEKFIFTIVLISVIGGAAVVVKTIMECVTSRRIKEKELFLKGVKIEL